MARQRITGTDLAKMFNAASGPIYVLDDEWTLVFCNRACLDWLAEAADGLLGRRCTYQSTEETTGPDRVAAGLCPPPDAMAGRPMTATVTCPDEQGRPRYRRAEFVPLGTDPDDLIGLVAILQEEDLAEPEEPWPLRPESEPSQLHDQVRRFRQQAAARYRAERLIGNSPAIRRVRAQVEAAVAGRGSVLLVGPPGSGRQHVAAAIHYGANSQATGSLIPLDCSLLGTDLIRSTIGALATDAALAEEVGRGTLLLNRADLLPPEIQAELVSTLGRKTFPLRLIATANTSLDELAAAGEYRADLAALLGTLVIQLPPLASRREDLPLLAQLLLERANAEGAKQVGRFNAEALDALDAYPWPGNVDELAQVVSEAHHRAEGPEVEAADLPERIHIAAEAAAYPPRAQQTIVLDEFLGQVEEELIRRALGQAKGNKAQAARLLGISRPRLYRRMIQLGLAEGDPSE